MKFAYRFILILSAFVLFIHSSCFSDSNNISLKEEKMNANLPLYSWVKNDSSIYLGKIVNLAVAPAKDGKEENAFSISIERTLSGAPAKKKLDIDLILPASETARLKFPDPVWGRVALKNDSMVFLVVNANDDPSKIIYADQVTSYNDPIIKQIAEIISVEKGQPDQKKKTAAYYEWLGTGSDLEIQYAANALAGIVGTGNADTDKIAESILTRFGAGNPVRMRISVGILLWDKVFPIASLESKIRIVNSTLGVFEEDDKDLTRFAFEKIIRNTDLEILKNDNIKAGTKTIRYFEDRSTNETSKEARLHINRIINILMAK
jgi:hypothetical protein